MRKLGLALCWALAAATVLSVFGAVMVWTTGWMFNLILHGAHGWKDTLGRVIGALIAAPVVGIAAGATCALAIGAPFALLLRRMGVAEPWRRPRRPNSAPLPYPSPPTYPPVPPAPPIT